MAFPHLRHKQQASEERRTASSGGVQLFGIHAVAAAWRNPRRVALRLLATNAGLKQIEPALQKAKQLGLKRPGPEIVEPQAIEKLLPKGAVHQGLMLIVESLPEIELEDILKNAEEAAFLVVLDQVTDPHNVGAILRSACAFGALAVAVTERHAPATTGTLAKAASGALDHTPLVRIGNLSQALDKIKKAGFWCIGLDESGENALHAIKMPAKVALVLGAEGEGLRRLTKESCDEIARLPTQQPIDSLNVSNAAVVAIYEVNQQSIKNRNK